MTVGSLLNHDHLLPTVIDEGWTSRHWRCRLRLCFWSGIRVHGCLLRLIFLIILFHFLLIIFLHILLFGLLFLFFFVYCGCSLNLSILLCSLLLGISILLLSILYLLLFSLVCFVRLCGFVVRGYFNSDKASIEFQELMLANHSISILINCIQGVIDILLWWLRNSLVLNN